jgi:tropomodulin
MTDSVNDILQQERAKYLGIDEDELLNGLSEADLNQLAMELEDMDPDNQLLPAGHRQRDHTKKEATGPLDREKLLDFIEEESKAVEDKEDFVPFESGTKRGKIFTPSDNAQSQLELDGFKMDPELEECLNSATEAEITDIAAILGMHTIMNNEQYYESLKAKNAGKIICTEGFSAVTKCKMNAMPANEPPNPTDIEETLTRIQDNEEGLTEVNLNNIKNIPIHTLIDYCEALKANTYVTKWCLANTRCNNVVANAIADMLKINRSVRVLNLESNYISAEAMLGVVETLEENDSLEELRIDNQRDQYGQKFENDCVAILDKNTTLLRFGYHFKMQSPRNAVPGFLMRNLDLKRKSRVQYNPSSVVTQSYVKKE